MADLEIEYEVKKDCIAYGKMRKEEYCRFLKCLYCKVENCKFYKPSSDYNLDGTKKKKRSEKDGGIPVVPEAESD